MKSTRNIAQKSLLFMKLQAACFGVNLDKENIIYSKKRLDNPKFIELLTESKNLPDNLEVLKDRNYIPQTQSLYINSISPSEQAAYNVDRNGNSKQISGPKNKQSIQDYLTQKLIAIQALSDQITNKEEVNQFFNKN